MRSAAPIRLVAIRSPVGAVVCRSVAAPIMAATGRSTSTTTKALRQRLRATLRPAMRKAALALERLNGAAPLRDSSEGRRWMRFVDDPAVTEEHDPVGPGRVGRVVGHEDASAASVAVIPKEAHDGLAGD